MSTAGDSRVARTAAALLAARRGRYLIAALDPELAPVTMEQAYAVQDAVTRDVGSPIVAWKVGQIPGSEWILAPIYREAVLESPGDVVMPPARQVVVEAEIAFVLGADLPVRALPYSRGDVLEAIHGACAAIEIGAPRLANFMDAPLEHKIADNIGNGALIRGECRRDFRDLPLDALHVRLTIDGNVVSDHVGGNMAGDPRDAVVALVNSRSRRTTLRAGDTIITGTCTGIHETDRAGEAIASFAGLGAARVMIRRVA